MMAVGRGCLLDNILAMLPLQIYSDLHVFFIPFILLLYPLSSLAQNNSTDRVQPPHSLKKL